METLELSVKVEYYADFTISMVSDQSTGDPGATHEFAVTIVNNANAAEEVSFAFEDIPSDWTYCILYNGNCLNTLNIAKGGSSSFTLEVTTPDYEPANVAGSYFTMIAKSSLNNNFEVHYDFKIMTNPTYVFSVETPSDTKTGSSGDTIPFQLTVKNLGNDVDYINLPSPILPLSLIHI